MAERSRLQLDPDLAQADLAGAGCTGHCFTIAKALQRYGMYLIENLGRRKVMTEGRKARPLGEARSTASTVSPIHLDRLPSPDHLAPPRG